MNFGIIGLLPLAGCTAGGGAAPATGFESVAGAGTTRTETGVNRLSEQVTHGHSEMSEFGSGFSDSKKHAVARQRARRAIRDRIYSRVQAFIKARVDVLLAHEKLEVATARVARELGLNPAEVRGIRNGDKRRIDEDILVILLPYMPDLLTENSSSENDLQQKEISEIRALVKDAALRLDRLEPAS